MSTKTTTTQPAEMPKVYRLKYPEDYYKLQSVSRYLRIRKLYVQQYTTSEGTENVRITYVLNGIQKIAQNLDEYGSMLAGELALMVMNWKPEMGIVVLSEQLGMIKQCDPSLMPDIRALPSASFDKRLSNFIQKADINGFGLSIDNEIVEIRPIVKTADIAERLGMEFVPR